MGSPAMVLTFKTPDPKNRKKVKPHRYKFNQPQYNYQELKAALEADLEIVFVENWE